MSRARSDAALKNTSRLSRTGPTLALVAALVLVVVATLTTGARGAIETNGVTGWRAFVCITCAPTWLADIISNIALFVPLGASLAALGVRPSRAAVVGVVVSCAIELLQYSGHPVGRTPAITDVLSNGAGALIGALAFANATSLLNPLPSRSARLAQLWTAFTVAVFAACAVALSPVARWDGAERVNDVSPSVSGLPFTPGYGWYAAYAEQPVVNGVPIRHGGNGPVIVSMPFDNTVRASVQVRGRDGRDGVVPIVFVHRPIPSGTDSLQSRAMLLLGQRGDDVVVGSELMAQRWGLVSPLLVSQQAFAPSGSQWVRAEATVTPHRWEVQWREVRDSSVARVAFLALSPALGWSLIQSVIGADVRGAWVLNVVWLVVWFGPLGFWVARSGGRTLVWAGVVLVTLWAMALGAGIAPLSAMEWAACVGASLVGARVGRRQTP
ncbi:MAG: VanZ family protein [Gemmatimonadaceae bacterium]|nr:VanZ family protein [Gemmatimonadaceae bacterium]